MSVGGPSSPIGQAEDPLLGRVLSERYRILKKLGEGGMGAVYLAEHVVIEKKIALKVLFPDLTRRPDLVQRFLQEAKSASRIGHENVIDITDFGQSEEGYVFIAMELLTGTELGQVLRHGGAMSWERAQPILLQIGKALRAAHEKGIVHRDMKPENVFIIAREGRTDFVKVLDFGIAKIVGMDEEGPRLTRTGMIFGTPEYMAPEQAQGAKIDPRVDVYAVGCIMYHMLTGTVPFRADSFMAVLSKHMLEEPTPPRVHNPAIATEVEAVIRKAMSKDPAGRFQSMAELCEVLSGLGPMQDVSARLRVRPARQATDHGRQTLGETGSGPVATNEYGRELPLAPPNPEMRRSQTEMVSRKSGGRSDPNDRAGGRGRTQGDDERRAGKSRGGLLLVGIGVLAVGGTGAFLALRGSPPPAAAPSVQASPVVPPPAAPPKAAVIAPPPSVPAPPAAASTKVEPAAEFPKESRRTRAEEALGKKRRSSREAIEALKAAGSVTADHPVREGGPALAPDPAVKAAVPVASPEIKNPFAPAP
jgi:serine/threonine protein kinase